MAYAFVPSDAWMAEYECAGNSSQGHGRAAPAMDCSPQMCGAPGGCRCGIRTPSSANGSPPEYPSSSIPTPDSYDPRKSIRSDPALEQRDPNPWSLLGIDTARAANPPPSRCGVSE